MKKLFLLGALLLAACANTKYSAYEGKNNIHQGNGGTKEVVDGIDIWSYGEPPKKFKILGIIEDSRPDGIISMSALDNDMAAQAKKVGGDAIIKLSANSEITGFISTGAASGHATHTIYGNTVYSSGNASAFGNTFAARKHRASYAVVKYLK